MVKVAICSVREDAAKAAAIAGALTKRGYAVWFDDTPSDDFWAGDTALEQIQRARAAILLWSEASSGSALFRGQATAARDRTRVIHVSIDGMIPLFPFDGASATDLSNWHGEAGNAEWKQLVRQLQGVAGAEAPREKLRSPSTTLSIAGPLLPARTMKAGLALCGAFLAGAMTTGLVGNAARLQPASLLPPPAGKAVAAAQPAAVPPKAASQPRPAAKVALKAPEPKIVAYAERREQPEIRAEHARRPSSRVEKAKRAGRPLEAKRARNEAPKPGVKPKIKYAYSENMRLFCERAGRGTPECRMFRRNAPKSRRGATRRV